MSQKNLKKIINKLIKEFTGTGASGGNAGDGNNITSPRPYRSDSKERESYMKKNVYGGEGGHYRNNVEPVNYNNLYKPGMFEEEIEEEEVEEQAYGHATLTTQGQSIQGAPGVWQEHEAELHEVEGGAPTGGAPTGGASTGGTNIYANQLADVDDEIEGLQGQINKKQVSKFDIQIAQAQSQLAAQASDSTRALADLDSQIVTLNNDEDDKEGEYLTLTLAYRELMDKDYFDLTDEDKKNKQVWWKTLSSLKKELEGIDKKRKELIQTKNNTKTGGGGIGSTIINLRKQKSDMAKQFRQQKQQVAESLYKSYVKDRKNKYLKEYMDSYKRDILLENAMTKFFNLFDEGKTDEEVLRIYAEQGVVVPEPFVKKARDKYKKLAHERLDLDELEQETKEFKQIQMMEDEPEVEEKLLSSKLQDLKEAEITDSYPIPPEIRETLVDTLRMDPLIRFVKNLKALNSIPPAYRIFLLNNQYFDIYFEEYSLMVKIGIDEYWLGDVEDINYAIKHINKLMTHPIPKTTGDEEKTPGGGAADLLGDLPPLPPPPEDVPPPPEEPEA